MAGSSQSVARFYGFEIWREKFERQIIQKRENISQLRSLLRQGSVLFRKFVAELESLREDGVAAGVEGREERSVAGPYVGDGQILVLGNLIRSLKKNPDGCKTNALIGQHNEAHVVTEASFLYNQ